MAAPLPEVLASDLSGFGGLRAAAARKDPAALTSAAQQFEALFTQQLFKAMRAAKLGDDALGGSGGELYTEMFDQQMALRMAQGRGIGLADQLVRQLRGLSPPAPAAPASAAVSGAGFALPASARLPSAPAALVTPYARALPYSAAQTTAAVSASTIIKEVEQGWKVESPEDFVRKIQPHAEKAAAALGVPAKVLIAQVALETGWGKHLMRGADGAPTYNFFGIKADRRWQGDSVGKATQEYENGKPCTQTAKFRAYDSIEAGFADYVHFLKANPRYASALSETQSGGCFATGLQKAGYATDPDYASKLLRIADGRTMRRASALPQMSV